MADVIKRIAGRITKAADYIDNHMDALRELAEIFRDEAEDQSHGG